MKKLLGLALLIGAGLVAARNLPDVKRYRRIRDM